jgi:hypothetical protein
MNSGCFRNHFQNPFFASGIASFVFRDMDHFDGNFGASKLIFGTKDDTP